MSKDQLRSFLEAVNTDTALQEKLKDAAEPDAVAAIAQSAGFESVSPELVTDFLEYVAAQSTIQQEGDQELSAVSGGLSPLAIAGIATGTVVGAAGILVAGYVAHKRKGEVQIPRQPTDYEIWDKGTSAEGFLPNEDKDMFSFRRVK